MFDLELSERRAEKTKDGILGNIHSKGVGGRKRAGGRAVEDCLENKRKQGVYISIEVILIRIRLVCNQITDLSMIDFISLDVMNSSSLGLLWFIMVSCCCSTVHGFT